MQKSKIRYVYDLELDDHGEILGGEFRSGGSRLEVQPDMVWMLARDQLAWSRSSLQANEGPTIDPNRFEIWDNIAWKYNGRRGNIPKDWFNAHLISAQFKYPANRAWSTIQSPAPLAEMVYYLFDQAKE